MEPFLTLVLLVAVGNLAEGTFVRYLLTARNHAGFFAIDNEDTS